ncbi:hypothetical protein Y032_0234g3145 [Ancylostoma ceylanicum]|uniref:Uncharacterized protein n=1 Tax=Ancylostoma ceylanicum TaxID=53326 RepID=A0A016SFV8_9BILA|nr:hypothetical protein Y032_0234g3145 [Ancylostoma ceylanicum]
MCSFHRPKKVKRYRLSSLEFVEICPRHLSFSCRQLFVNFAALNLLCLLIEFFSHDLGRYRSDAAHHQHSRPPEQILYGICLKLYILSAILIAPN